MIHWHRTHADGLTTGERLADQTATFMGSWRFIVMQSVFVVCWMTANVAGLIYQWDVYPFILLNLVFSVQAVYAAPIIMMAQNRQSDRDRHHAEADYQTNLAAKAEIEALQLHLARIENDKLDELLRRVGQPARVQVAKPAARRGRQGVKA